MPKALPKIYWDACAWIGLVNCEPDKLHALRVVWEAAQHGKCEMWTSTYIYMEFLKGHVGQGQAYSPEENDAAVEAMLNQPYVKRIQFDVVCARMARKLKRDHHSAGLKKRSDAIHLAAALRCKAEELHTYDKSHLLPFDKICKHADGTVLRIIKASDSNYGQSLFNDGSFENKSTGS